MTGPGEAGETGWPDEAASPPDIAAAATPAGCGHLRLIATSDLHAQILSYDYYSNRPLFGSGLARIACLIDEARRGAAASLLLDNGDFLQGSALADPDIAGRRGRVHPAIAAFNTLGYDAAALGNHEFNYGLGFLRRAVAGAGFPVLSANVLTAAGPDPLQDRFLCTPFALVARRLAGLPGGARGITIGILGLTPPEILQWDRRHLEGHILVRPMAEAARAWVPELRRRGADLVVCLAHTGVSANRRTNGSDAQAAAIAALPGVDAVIAGHSHLTFPDGSGHPDPRVDSLRGRIAGKPVVQPGHEGSHLGIIDLWLRPARQGWQVAQSETRLIHGSESVAGLPARKIRAAAAALRDSLAPDHRAALSKMRRRLGTSTIPLSTWFAHVADCQALRLIGAAKMRHARRALAATPWAGLPMVALVSAYRCGGRGGPQHYSDIPPGPLSLRHVFDLYPFPNTVTAEVMTGAGLAARLDRASAIFNRIAPGRPDQMLIDPQVPGFSYEVAVGADYRIDLSRPCLRDRPADPRPGTGRIRDLGVGGRPLGPAERVVVVTNSYLASSHALASERLVLDDHRLCTDAIADYIREAGRIGPHPGGGWSFVPMPGTSLLFDTGSGCAGHLAELAALRPEPMGLTEGGFSRFRLHPG